MSKTKEYGSADPALTFVVSGVGGGLVAPDTQATAFTGSLTRAAGETLAGGPYAITQGTLAPTSNYSLLNFNNGELTITAKAATWTTSDSGKSYGNSDPIPLTTGSASGFLAADGVTATYSRAAGESVGNLYHITTTLTAIGSLSNYTITQRGRGLQHHEGRVGDGRDLSGDPDLYRFGD